MKKRVRNILCAAMALAMALPAACYAEETVELTFSYWGSNEEKVAIEKALEAFEEAHPGVSVTPMYIPNDEYNTKITTMLAAGELPDMGYMMAIAFDWAEQGLIVDLADKIEADPGTNMDDYLDACWNIWDGKHIGLMGGSEPFAIFYNEDLTSAAGIEVPDSYEEAWTWDEFVEVCKKLTIDANGNNALSPDFDPENIVQYGVQFPITDPNVFTTMVYSNGGEFFDAEGNYKLNEPAAVEAIQKMADLVNVHHVAPSAAITETLPSTAVCLQVGKTAMTVTGQWVLLDLQATEGLNYNVGVLPKMKECVTMMSGGMICLFEGSEHPEEQWELWKWMTNPENTIDLHAKGLWAPLMSKYYEDPELLALWTDNEAHPSGYKGSCIDMSMEHCLSSASMFVKEYEEVSAIVTSAFDDVVLGNKTVQEVLDGIETQVQNAMSE